MRTFILSLFSLALLIGLWGIFFSSTHQSLQHQIFVCESEVLPSVEQGNWDDAYQTFEQQYQHWNNYQKKAKYIIETDILNDIDETYNKTLVYIKAKDLSNSSGELLSLAKALDALYNNEKPCLANIL